MTLLIVAAWIPSLAGCATYSSTLSVDAPASHPRRLSKNEIEGAVQIVGEIASKHGLQSSAIALEGSRRATRDDASTPHLPIAVYMKSEKMFPDRADIQDGSSASIRLLLERRKDGRGLRVVIHDLTNDEATLFTNALTKSLTTALQDRFRSYELTVRTNRVAKHFYAP